MLNARLIDLQEMKDKITLHLKILKEELNKQVVNSDLHMGERAINSLWKEYFKKYLDEFTDWIPTVYEDPFVISLFSKNPQIFPAHVGPKYTLEDFRYSAAYPVTRNRVISALEPMSRCSDCQESKKTIKTILTDYEWERMIETERQKLKDIITAEGYNFARLNFFMPHYDVIYERIRNETSGRNYESLRKKRSLFDTNMNSQNILTHNADNTDNIISKIYKKTVYVANVKSRNNIIKQSNNTPRNFFSWLASSVNQIFNTKKVLPTKVINPDSPERIAGSSNNFAALSALIDVNGTILLLDAMIRKFTGQKYTSSAADYSAALIDARAYSLDVGMAFEKSMKYAASRSGISIHRFNIHYIEIQEKVIDKIMSGKLDEIVEILISHAENACPLRKTGCPGKLSPKKFKKFIDIFSKRIEVELNEIMQRNKTINKI